MTAARLLDLLTVAGCEPTAVAGPDGPELEYLSPAPPGVEEFVPLLRSGVVALLGRRRWFGLAADGHAVELSPRSPLPPGVLYLAVERRPGDSGDGRWDAVQPHHRRQLAGSFDRPPQPAKRRDTADPLRSPP